MNLKPDIKKIIISIIFTPLLAILLKFFLWMIFCTRGGCAAVIKLCYYYDIFSCCSKCISQSTYILQKITFLLVPFLIIYWTYSYFQNKKKKNKSKLFIGLFVILLLGISLFFLSHYIGEDNPRGRPFFLDEKINKQIMNPPSLIQINQQLIKIKKEQDNKIPFTIKNIFNESRLFSYKIYAKGFSCNDNNLFNLNSANNLISEGERGKNIKISAGNLSEPIYVKFNVTEATPSCFVRYSIEFITSRDISDYKPTDFYLEIID